MTWNSWLLCYLRLNIYVKVRLHCLSLQDWWNMNFEEINDLIYRYVSAKPMFRNLGKAWRTQPQSFEAVSIYCCLILAHLLTWGDYKQHPKCIGMHCGKKQLAGLIPPVALCASCAALLPLYWSTVPYKDTRLAKTSSTVGVMELFLLGLPRLLFLSGTG